MNRNEDDFDIAGIQVEEGEEGSYYPSKEPRNNARRRYEKLMEEKRLKQLLDDDLYYR